MSALGEAVQRYLDRPCAKTAEAVFWAQQDYATKLRTMAAIAAVQCAHRGQCVRFRAPDWQTKRVSRQRLRVQIPSRGARSSTTVERCRKPGLTRTASALADKPEGSAD